MLAIGIPGVSWLDGTGRLAWTMYSSSAHYRLRIRAWDGAGRARWIAPSRLAASAEPRLRAVLAGAEGFLHGPTAGHLRPHLDRLARVVCSLEPVTRVVIDLDERRNLDAPVRTTRSDVECSAKTRAP